MDRERKYLEMENLYCEPLGVGQNSEDMGCACADLGTQKLELDKSHPSYADDWKERG